MANAFNVNGNINQFDIAGSIQQGMRFGQQQRDLRESREREQKVRSLAPQVIAGDPNAYSQAAAIDPEAAAAYQGAGDSQLRRLQGAVNYFDNARKSGNPQGVQAAFRQVSPFLTQMTGQQAPEAYDEATMGPAFEQLRARLAMLPPDTKGMPSGYREFQLSAQAAGLQPGTPEYERAAKVALGLEGRAASGGFGFKMITGADGRERMGRQNPRTGSFEIYDEQTGEFMPLGGAGSLNGSRPAGSVPVEGGGTVQLEQVTGPDGQPINFGADVPPQVRQQILSQQHARPSLGVSRSKEEEAGAVTAAQEQAKLGVLPAELDLRTQAAIEQAGGVEAAKIGAEKRAERLAALPQTIAAADQTVELLDAVMNHPGRLSATGKSSLNPLNRVPGTAAYDFNVLLDQIKGQAFLQAFQSLKGGGAITEREGQAATNAIARLNAAQSEEAFVQAIRDLRKIVTDGRARTIQSAASGQSQTLPATPRSTSVADPLGIL